MEILVVLVCVIVIWNLTLTKKIYQKVFSTQRVRQPIITPPPTPEQAPTEAAPASSEDEFGLFFSTVESIRKKTRRTPKPLRRPVPAKADRIQQPSIAMPYKAESQKKKESHASPPPPQAQSKVPKRKLEQWIGTQLLSKLGLALFIIGMGMLLKHTLGFIGRPEIANSILGVLVASTTLFFGYRLRHKTPTFAAILMAGAFVIYHLTLMVGHLYYEIYSESLAILLYSINALAAAFLAIKRNRQELLIIAQIGIWVSPFFTPDFFNNSAILLLYVFAYAAGALLVALKKKWKFAMLTAWIGSAIHIALVMLNHAEFAVADRMLLIAIHLLFTFPMFTSVIRELWSLRSRSAYALGAQLFFLLTGTVIVDSSLSANWLGVYATGMAIAAWTLLTLHHHRKISIPEFWILPVAVLTTVLAPVLHFELSSFSLILSLEALALVFIGHRHQDRALKGYALIIVGLAGIAVSIQSGIFWWNRSIEDLLLLNSASLSALAFVVALTGMAMFYAKDALIRLPLIGLTSASALPKLLIGMAKWFVYAFTSLELLSWTTMNLANAEAVFLVNASFQIGCFLLLTHLVQRIDQWRFLQATGGVFLLLYGVLLAGPAQDLYVEALQGKLHIGWTLAHVPVLLACMYLATRSWSFISKQTKMEPGHILNLVIMTIGWLVVLSREFDLIALQFHMPVGSQILETIRENRLWGYAPLWSVLAFIFVWIGFRKSRLTDRWAGLGIFCLLLFKLFFMDIFELPKGAQIVAFMVLGLLLIVVSFFYHKLKEMLTTKDP